MPTWRNSGRSCAAGTASRACSAFSSDTGRTSAKQSRDGNSALMLSRICGGAHKQQCCHVIVSMHAPSWHLAKQHSLPGLTCTANVTLLPCL